MYKNSQTEKIGLVTCLDGRGAANVLQGSKVGQKGAVGVWSGQHHHCACIRHQGIKLNNLRYNAPSPSGKTVLRWIEAHCRQVVRAATCAKGQGWADTIRLYSALNRRLP